MGRTYNPTHRWRRNWAEWHVKNGGTYASAPEFYAMACELYLAGATAKAAGISTAALFNEKAGKIPAAKPVIVTHYSGQTDYTSSLQTGSEPKADHPASNIDMTTD